MFTRLGEFGYEYIRSVTVFGSALDTQVEAIRDQFETGAQGVVVDGIYAARDSARSSPSGWLSYLKTAMQKVCVEQTNDDVALISKSLTDALAEIIRQMKSGSQSILRGTSSASVSAYSGNKGDGKIALSFINPYGDAIATSYVESIKFTCSSDSTAYGESFSIAGQPTKSVSDPTWPGGSGCTGAVTLFNAETTSYIANGNYSDWSNPSAAPANWTIATGAAGTSIVRDNTTKRSGGYALQMVSDGSTLLKIKQQLNASSIAPNQVLCLSFWGKMSATDSSGILTCRLVDGSGTVLTNDAGNNLSFTTGMNGGSGIGTSYTNVSGFFSLPRQLPTTASGVFLEIYFSTSPGTGKTLNLSLVGLTKANPLYAGGPYYAAFSAASRHSVGDYMTAAISNSVGTSTWVRASQRWLDMPSQGDTYYFPTVTTSETVADSLLT